MYRYILTSPNFLVKPDTKYVVRNCKCALRDLKSVYLLNTNKLDYYEGVFWEVSLSKIADEDLNISIIF
jgi:hypothetical protein